MGIVAGLVVLAGLFVGWNLGANDGANAMGTAVGAKVRTLRQAVFLVAVFGFLGAVLLGDRVIKTIGKGIVPMEQLDSGLAMHIALAAMFAAGLWILLATYLKLPVSTTHATVGAVAGAGLAAHNVPILWNQFIDICLAWILTPLGSALIALLISKLLAVLFAGRSVGNGRWISFLLTLSGIYMAFAWGANDVANATGIMLGAGIISAKWAAALGGLAIALGVATWGYKVMETIGTRITHLVPLMAFVAELSAALNVFLYTMWGLPVSTTHSIVGAVFGVGLANGRAALNSRTIRDIVAAWASTPLISGAISFLLFYLFLPLFA
ncbi:MAG TPA: inorganic phosphate transporter [Firmicutes bacterium]|nr:inorganic phosphate transporter [Bacillota bacterium]